MAGVSTRRYDDEAHETHVEADGRNGEFPRNLLSLRTPLTRSLAPVSIGLTTSTEFFRFRSLSFERNRQLRLEPKSKKTKRNEMEDLMLNRLIQI